jgi:SAM-dependent methyltransferase
LPDTVPDTWEQGDGYERYIGRWSRRVAPLFLSWLDMPPGRRWLDVGCGTGALCAAILEHCAPQSVAGVEPSDGFLATARERVGDRVAFHQGSATQIPLEDAAVDVVVSGLVLNFVSDAGAALTEMTRVAGPGGTIAAYVWDYAGEMQLIRYFWDAAVELDASAAPMDEGVRFPSCRPDALRELFASAGLAAVDATAITIATPFRSFDEYWQGFLGAQGPAPAYAMSLDAPGRARLHERLRTRLPIAPDGSIPLTARAWAVRGTAPSRHTRIRLNDD